MTPFHVFQVDEAAELEPYVEERAAIEAAGGTFDYAHCTTEDEVIARAGDAEVLWVGWLPVVTARVLDALPNVRLLIRWGVGYDQLPVRDATARGVAVANCPAYGTDDVAEHAVTLALAGARRLTTFHEAMRAGVWDGSAAQDLVRMKGRTVGIVGVGRIGSSAAWRFRGLGFRVIGYDKYRTAGELRAIDVEPVGLEELLERADIVSLHVPLTDETRGLMGAAELARMRDGAVLVNTSRGGVIDQDALLAALHAGRPAFASLDVFREEPMAADAPIRQAPNVCLTPHIAGASVDALVAVRREMLSVTLDWQRDSWAASVVNPEVRGSLRPRPA